MPEAPWTHLRSAVEATRADFAERYVEQRILGAGGAGEVLAVYDRVLRRPIALKTLRKQAPDDAVLRRFLQEAQVTGQLEHPNIVPVHDVGVTPQGSLYFTMRRVRGRSLAEALKEGQLQGDAALLRVFLKIGDAVAYAHSRGVVHRDIKPSNVMLGEFGEVQLVDWGVAKLVDATDEGTLSERGDAPVTSDEDESQGSLTRVGNAVGTPMYMAPEQARAEHERVGPLTDVYALGALLYVMLTGAKPFDRGPLLLARVGSGQMVPPRQRRPSMPWELEAVVLKAMATDPAHRYTGARELSRDIERWLEGLPVSAATYGVVERGRKWLRRNSRMASAVAVTAGAAGVVLIVMGTLWLRNVIEARDRALAAEHERLLQLADARVALGRLLEEQGDTRGAAMAFDEATDAYGDSPLSWRARIAASWLAVDHPPPIARVDSELSPALASDGSAFATFRQGTVDVFSLPDFARLTSLDVPQRDLVRLALAPNLRVAARGAESWSVLDAGGSVLLSVPRTSAADLASHISRDGSAFVRADGTGTQRFALDGTTGPAIAWMLAHATSADGRIAVGPDTRTHGAFAAVDLASGEQLATLPWLDGPALDSAGDWLVGRDREAEQLVGCALPHCPEPWTQPSPATPRNSLSHGRLVSIDEHGAVVREPRTGTIVSELALQEPVSPSIGEATAAIAPWMAAFSPPELRLFAMPDGPAPRAHATAAAVSADGVVVVLGTEGGRVELVEATTLTPIGGVQTGVGTVRRLDLSSTGTLLVAGTEGRVEAWDLAANRLVGSWVSEHAARSAEVVWLDDERAAILPDLGDAVIWTPTTGQDTPLDIDLGQVWTARVSKGRLLMTGRAIDEPTWELRDIASGAQLGRGSEMMVGYGAAWAPDAERFAFTTHDQRALIVDADGNETVADRASDVAFSIDWSSDGALLAVSYLGGEVRILDGQSAALLGSRSFTGGVAEVRFLPGSHRILVVGARGTAVYDLDLADRLRQHRVSLDAEPSTTEVARAAALRRSHRLATQLFERAHEAGEEVPALEAAASAWSIGDHSGAASWLAAAPQSDGVALWRAQLP